MRQPYDRRHVERVHAGYDGESVERPPAFIIFCFRCFQKRKTAKRSDESGEYIHADFIAEAKPERCKYQKRQTDERDTRSEQTPQQYGNDAGGGCRDKRTE